MRLINANTCIKTLEEYRDETTNYYGSDYEAGKYTGYCLSIDKINDIPIVNAIIIPDNATNGEVLKAVFPNAEIDFIRKMSGINHYRVRGIDELHDEDGQIFPITHIFYEDWWNAKYKEGK